MSILDYTVTFTLVNFSVTIAFTITLKNKGKISEITLDSTEV